MSAMSRPGSSLQYPMRSASPPFVIWPLLSDRMQERKWNTALAFLVAAGGLALSSYFPDPVHKMTLLCIETNPTPTRGRGFGAS